jgi:branched-chain amino acid transport system permease protein
MFIIQQMISGLATGSMYALIAIGYSLIWSGMRVVNFAQGEVFMFGAFIAVTFFTILHQSFIVSLAVGILSGSLLGWLIYKFAVLPVLRKGFLFVIASCVGAQILLQNVAIVLWGASGIRFPSVFSTVPLKLMGILVVPQDLWMFGIGIAAMLLLYLFLNKTKTGTAMRAAAQNKEVVALMGVNRKLTDSLTFFIGGALAALAGILLAPKMFVTPLMGTSMTSKAFSAAVIGGFGSIPGAVFGGFILGIIENIAGGFISSGYKDAISFLILILILMFKPDGLLTRK